MGLPRLTFNGKNVDFLKAPNELIVDVGPPVVITRTLRGIVDTLATPRVDIHVIARWQNIDSASLLVQLEDAWQWIKHGEDFSFALDSAKTVDTMLSSQEAAGQIALNVTSESNVTNGQVYKLIGGPYYGLVTVSSTGAGVVNVTSPINFTFASGSIFRDRFYFPGRLIDPHPRTPFRYVPFQSAVQRFDFELDFYEKVA